MKKSNKILLGGFLVAVLLLSALHITLWAKYQNGNYVAYQPEDELASMVMQSFPHVKFVSVRNVPGLAVHFSDSAQIEEGMGKELRYTQRGDTLEISATDSLGQQNFYGEVAMRLPRNASLHAFKSTVSFTDNKGTGGGNPVVFLDQSRARFYSTRIDLLRIHAVNKSSIELADAQISNLQLQLQNSSLEDGEGQIGELSISTDSLSRIGLQAKHFSKAKLNAPAHD